MTGSVEPRFFRSGGEDSIKNESSSSPIWNENGNGTRLNNLSLPLRRQ